MSSLPKCPKCSSEFTYEDGRLVTAWAQNHAHPTFIDFKHNYLKNKLALPMNLPWLALRIQQRDDAHHICNA